VIRAPGMVVPKQREWREVIRDLKKMRKELNEVPVLQGLDDPSMRSFSPPSAQTSGQEQ